MMQRSRERSPPPCGSSSGSTCAEDPAAWFQRFAQEGDDEALVAQWRAWQAQAGCHAKALRWLLRRGLDDSTQASAAVRALECLLRTNVLAASSVEQELAEYSPEDLEDVQLDNPKADQFVSDVQGVLHGSQEPEGEDLSAEALTTWLVQRYSNDRCIPEHMGEKRNGMGKWVSDAFDTSSIACWDLPHSLGVVLENVFSRQECQRIVDETERVGYGATSFPQQYRGNRRLQLDDVDTTLAGKIWERIRGHVPQRLHPDWLPANEENPTGEWEAVGCNTRFRFSKYFSSDRFQTHSDSMVYLGPDFCSLLTVNVYLNDLSAEQAGRTRFFLHRGGEPVGVAGGCAGSLVLFRQGGGGPLHDGDALASGLKYLLRTDVMYRKVQ